MGRGLSEQTGDEAEGVEGLDFLVVVVSSVIHMASPWHKSDYPKLPNEDQVMDALRPIALPPGDYMVPRPSTRAEMGSEAFLDKMKRGPR